MLAEAARTTTVRWILGIAAALVAQSCLIALLVYAETVSHAMAELDGGLARECSVLAGLAPADLFEEVGEKVERDVHRINLVGVFAADGSSLAGNIKALPTAIATASGPITLDLIRTQPYDPTPNSSRVVACDASQGRRLVVARDLDDIDALRALVGRALALAVFPALAVATLLGVVLGRHGQTRFRLVRAAIDEVMAGNIKRRLPQGRSHDPFDRLSHAVNDMLDRLEEAIEDVSALGDDIAHALRTPLTRMRARLERSLDPELDAASLSDINRKTIGDIDHALAIVSAILRIRTIEATKRSSRFAPLDVSQLLADAVELYQPLAEEKAITLVVEPTAPAAVVADRDLLMEALCNLVDNAIKFTPPQGAVRCRIASQGGRATMIEIADTGPGIPSADHGAVLRRFHRGAQPQPTEGYGIGLSLVAAILKLHGFSMKIDDASPGCRIVLDVSSAMPRPEPLGEQGR